MNKILVPRADYILVEYEPKDVTSGGIVLPDTKTKKDHAAWKVLGVGDKVKDIAKGDYILFDALCAKGLNVEGMPDNLFVVVEDNVIGKIKTV